MILVISLENDSMTDFVCQWLSYQEKKYVRLNENQRITSLFFDFSEDSYEIATENERFSLNDIKTVFYRNGALHFHLPEEETDKNLLPFIKGECQSIEDFIFYYLKSRGTKIYGNLFNKTVNKLNVLHTAKKIGFKIPETFVFTHSKDLHRLQVTDKYITKAVFETMPLLYEDGFYTNFTREISLNKDIEQNKNYIPTLLQSKIYKNYEIRVFFFHQKIWAVATFDLSNNIDVRNMHVSTKKYIPYQLPVEICKRIDVLAEELELNCGTIDILKTEDEYYFLEVNPLGQFQEVSYFGNYNLEKYIADLL